jgi:transcriptional regulator with XRE-family HTH domain
MAPKTTVDLKTRQRIAANMRLLMWEQRFDSVAGMADALGMSRSALGRYLKGERTPGLDVLLLVHRKLGVSLDYLSDRDPPREWFDVEYTPPKRR